MAGRSGAYGCVREVGGLAVKCFSYNDQYTTYNEALVELTAQSLLPTLQAPSFVRFHGACTLPDDMVAMAMDYASGKSLQASVLQTPEQLRDCMFQLLWSLLVAQIEVRFQHRDLKAGNIVYR